MNPASCSEVSSILIIGSFDGGNAGDTAVLWEIMSQLNDNMPRRPHYLVPTSSPRFVESYYSAFDCEPLLLTVKPRRGYLRFLGPSTLSALHRSDLILTTAGIFFDYKLSDPHFSFVSSLAPLLTLAVRRNIPIVGYGIGVVPPTHSTGYKILRYVLNLHDRVFLRDHLVERMLRGWRLRGEICLGADAAFTTRSATKSEVSTLLSMCLVDSCYPIVALNVSGYVDSFSETRCSLSRNEFEQCIANVASYINKELTAKAVLVCTSIGDEPTARSIATRVGGHTPILSPSFLSHSELAGILGQAGLVIGMRMHACLFAAIGGVPIVSLNYSPKVKNLMAMLGLSEFSLEMVDVSEERLKSVVADAWKRRGENALLLQRNLSALVDMGHSQAAAVAAMLCSQKNEA